MGASIFLQETYTLNLDIIRGITPVKTEPEVLRAITDLIAVNIQTQQMLGQLAGRGQGLQGGSFIGKGMRADEGSAFDDSAEQVRLLSQRVEELEKRLGEGTTSKAATGSNK